MYAAVAPLREGQSRHLFSTGQVFWLPVRFTRPPFPSVCCGQWHRRLSSPVTAARPRRTCTVFPPASSGHPELKIQPVSFDCQEFLFPEEPLCRKPRGSAAGTSTHLMFPGGTEYRSNLPDSQGIASYFGHMNVRTQGLQVCSSFVLRFRAQVSGPVFLKLWTQDLFSTPRIGTRNPVKVLIADGDNRICYKKKDR